MHFEPRYGFSKLGQALVCSVAALRGRSIKSVDLFGPGGASADSALAAWTSAAGTSAGGTLAGGTSADHALIGGVPFLATAGSQGLVCCLSSQHFSRCVVQ